MKDNEDDILYYYKITVQRLKEVENRMQYKMEQPDIEYWDHELGVAAERVEKWKNHEILKSASNRSIPYIFSM
jgi:hypothetical protein